MPPDPVRTTGATGQGSMRNVNLEFAVFNVRAIPQRIGLVGETGWRTEIRDVPFLMRRHAAGHVIQLGKVVCPEILVKVQIAVVALGGLPQKPAHHPASIWPDGLG